MGWALSQIPLMVLLLCLDIRVCNKIYCIAFLVLKACILLSGGLQTLIKTSMWETHHVYTLLQSSFTLSPSHSYGGNNFLYSLTFIVFLKDL